MSSQCGRSLFQFDFRQETRSEIAHHRIQQALSYFFSLQFIHYDFLWAFLRELQRSFVARFNSFVCKVKVMHCTHHSANDRNEVKKKTQKLEIKLVYLKMNPMFADSLSLVVHFRFIRFLCTTVVRLLLFFETEIQFFAFRHVIFIDSICQLLGTSSNTHTQTIAFN